jgi:oligopeptide transport system substrate-binding protein
MFVAKVLKAAALSVALSAGLMGAAQAVTLNLHNGSDPRTLDPAKASGNWEDRVISDMIEGLMTLDIKGNPILGQAASYEISDDKMTYTFTLRDDIFWSDGTPVTAKDFVTGLERLANPATASEYAYLMSFITGFSQINDGSVTDMSTLGVKALDDKHVEYKLNGPTPYFLGALTHYTAYPVPTHVVEAKGEDWSAPANIVGNGPYHVIEWVPGSYLKSVKNDLYYDAANVQIDEIMYYVLEDNPAALNRYRAGEFDILSDFPPDQYQMLQANYSGQAHVAPFLGVYYYNMNQLEGNVLADKDIRKALSISVMREVIGPEVLGTGELPAYGWVPPGASNYEGEQYLPEWADTPYEERVAEAKAILESKGYTAQNPLPLRLRYNINDAHQRIAIAIAAMWEPIGVKIEMLTAEGGVHYDALESGDFEVGRAGWIMDYDDPSNVLDLLKSGVQQGDRINWGNNYGRWSNAEYDSLLAQAANEVDLVKRAGLMHQAEKIAMDDFAVMPIYWYVSNWVVSPKVTGFEDNAADRHFVRYMTKSE